MELKNIEGQRFGRLVAVKREEGRHWLFRCDCGKQKKIDKQSVRRGEALSCGCLRSEMVSARRFKHGLTKSRFYNIWCKIRERCFDESALNFQNYGGRGITCDWNDFEAFRRDMHRSYVLHVAQEGEKNTTIERLDVMEGYNKTNCTWASQKLQQRNRRNNVLVEYRGEKRCIGEWAERYNMSYFALYSRIRRGWSLEEALHTRVGA